MPHSVPTPPPPSVCPTRLITSARIPSFLFTQHHRKACQLFTHARTRSHAYAGEKKNPQMLGMLSSATYKHKINLYNLICHKNTHICKYRAANRLSPPPACTTHRHAPSLCDLARACSACWQIWGMRRSLCPHIKTPPKVRSSWHRGSTGWIAEQECGLKKT